MLYCFILYSFYVQYTVHSLLARVYREGAITIIRVCILFGPTSFLAEQKHPPPPYTPSLLPFPTPSAPLSSPPPPPCLPPSSTSLHRVHTLVYSTVQSTQIHSNQE